MNDILTTHTLLKQFYCDVMIKIVTRVDTKYCMHGEAKPTQAYMYGPTLQLSYRDQSVGREAYLVWILYLVIVVYMAFYAVLKNISLIRRLPLHSGRTTTTLLRRLRSKESHIVYPLKLLSQIIPPNQL